MCVGSLQIAIHYDDGMSLARKCNRKVGDEERLPDTPLATADRNATGSAERSSREIIPSVEGALPRGQPSTREIRDYSASSVFQ